MEKKFFIFEGIDGSGKSTLISSLYEHLTSSIGFNSVICLREPTMESKWGRQIKKLLAETALSETQSREIPDLFRHDRLWDLENNIFPALRQNKIVLLDRYFFSTAAYQAQEKETAAVIINEYLKDTRFLLPDALFFLEITPSISLKRIFDRNKQAEVFEKKETLEKIAANYQFIFKTFQFPFPVYSLNAEQPQENILRETLSLITES